MNAPQNPVANMFFTILLMFLTSAVFYLCNTKINKSTQNFFSITSNPNTTTITFAITFFAKEAEIQDKTQRYLSNKVFSSTANKFPLRVPEADACRILVQTTWNPCSLLLPRQLCLYSQECIKQWMGSWIMPLRGSSLALYGCTEAQELIK